VRSVNSEGWECPSEAQQIPIVRAEEDRAAVMLPALRGGADPHA